MKLYLDRKYKKETYTIGRLYIDGKLTCNTLEPADRGLVNKAIPKYGRNALWQRAKQDAVLMKSTNAKGTTAIPAGQYRVKMQYSPKFRAQRPLLQDVPGFEGILIHEGNSRKDTQGCILVGMNTKMGCVRDSKKSLTAVMGKIKAAQKVGETVMLQIV